MSRALLRVANALQCDCAAASSSKRTLVTLPGARPLGPACPARRSVHTHTHEQHPYWNSPVGESFGAPHAWNQEHWQWAWRQRVSARLCGGRNGVLQGRAHCEGCTCHLHRDAPSSASSAQSSASASSQQSASFSAQRSASTSASATASAQHGTSSSWEQPRNDDQAGYDHHHAFWHRYRHHHPWAFHAHLTRRWLFLTGRLLFGTVFRLVFWPLCRWQFRRAWTHWAQRSSSFGAHAWQYRRMPWHDHWRTNAHHHPHQHWHPHAHEKSIHCLFSSAIRRVCAGAGRLFPTGLRLFGTSPFARGALEYSPFAPRMGHACPRGKGSCPGNGPRFSGGRRACGQCPYAEGADSAPVNAQFYSLVKCSATLLSSSAAVGSDSKADISGRRLYSMQVRIEYPSGTPAPMRSMTTLSISTRIPAIRRPTVISLDNCQHPQQLQQRQFHASCRCEAPPLFIWLAGFLKSSASLGFIQTITRVAMTLLPVTFLKLKIASKLLKRVDEPVKREKFARHIVMSRKLIVALFVVPASLFFSALLASLERTPLTGRWRLILMSPQEEDDVSKQLQGTGWYNAVADILLSNSDGKMPKVIPVTDWRYRWVDDTLRKLESFLPVFRNEGAYVETLLKTAPPDFPTPPPSRFPLVPRPRISQILHCFFFDSSSAAAQKEHEVTDAPHSVVGTPFNLLLVEKPDTSNGFSYGFGGGGAAGIVVFSGFLDEILKSSPPASQPAPTNSGNPWSSFLGLGSSSQSKPRDPVPTAEQTALLAVLLAHEISHLMLAHHLETLSNSTIFAPGVVGLFADVLRTLLFPVTMLLGPFVNDAVANMTRESRSTILEGHEACFNRKLEIEADIVSARILAYAGFDPRIAIDFWESRLPPPQSPGSAPNTGGSNGHFWRGGGRTRDSHPVREERIQRLKAELARWDAERPRPKHASVKP